MARKVCIVVTARPSYSRIKTVLDAVAAHGDLELQLVMAASALLDRYGKAVDVAEREGFEVAARVSMVLEGENLMAMAKTTGLGLLEISGVLANLAPDLVVTVADRYETIATAVAAAYMNIPLAHLQGGEVTGSIDEKVRHAVTKLADVHFVATERARERVIRMGEDPDTVFLTGCPSLDLARQILEEPEMDFDPFSRYKGVGVVQDLSRPYLVVLQHPVTTECDAATEQVQETLHTIRDLGVPALWFWPNVDAGADGLSRGIRRFRELEKPGNIYFFKNMVPNDFLRLVYNSSCIVGNSSVAIRECSFMGVPAVNIGTRQDGRERGKNVLDVACERDAIRRGVEEQMKHDRFESDKLYGDGDSGVCMADLLSACPLKIEKRLQY